MSPLPLFDEAFLRRMERLSYRTAPTLRGGLVGERRSRNLRPALDFSDHRPYVSGDDLRHVDWYAYARHKALFVKLGEATQRIDLHLLLDASRSMGWQPSDHFMTAAGANAGQRFSNKWDMARRMAGALSYLGLASGERVKLTSFATSLGDGFGPVQGKRQVMPVLDYLSHLAPSLRGDASNEVTDGLATSLAAYAQANPRGGLLLIISDLLDTAIDAAGQAGEAEILADGLRHLPAPRWQVLVMHLLTQQELQPTLSGDFDLEDIETEESLPFRVDEPTLAQYRLRVRHWCATLQSACARRGATYSQILAEWPLEQKVIPYLRQRGLFQ